MRRTAKRVLWGIFLALVFIPAVLSGFGRFRAVYTFFAQAYALVPGLPGDYLRIAWYHLTLRSCSLDARISFGTIVSHPETVIASGVYIGAFSLIGKADIGQRCQVASYVQILSGKKQHGRDSEGRLLSTDEEAFSLTRIGADSWIGAAAIVMADVGNSVTVGAGSVVTRPIEAYSIAVGNPARVISRSAEVSDPSNDADAVQSNVAGR